MRKTSKLLSRVIKCFTDDLEQRFPGLEFEPLINPEDGYDAWVYVHVPPGEQASEDEIRTFARETENRYWRESGVGLMTMIRRKEEPVHG
jgi:hypothetical protein